MNFKGLMDDVYRIRKETEGLYIYGAGFYGKDICRVLQKRGVETDGFLTTEEPGRDAQAMGKPVLRADTVLGRNIGIILGLSDTYTDQVKNYLEKKRFPADHVADGGRYITDTGGREDLRDSRVLEVSTVMGCRVSCHYCPQELLLREYYKDNKNRQGMMSLRDFQTVLAHTPQECIIDFSGMTEPFNNPHCMEMIEMACSAGRKVYLFTTLAEVGEAAVDRLLSLPVYYMTLHVADRKGYARIPATETYYRNIEKAVRARKPDGRPFVDFINAQADPDPRVAAIAGEDYEIMRSVQNRAGNVEDGTAQHRKADIRPGERIRCCFCGDDLSNSVVLPDGTLLLCNMDYGMKHVLGNLYEEDYDTVRSKGELQRVLRAMDGREEMDGLLCRKCLLARVE